MIKTLAKSVRQYKGASVLASIFMLVDVGSEVMVPFLMASLIDEGIVAKDFDYIVRMGTILLSLTLVSIVSGWLSGMFAARGACGFAANLRHDIFSAVQKFSFSNIDKYSSASLVTRLTTDVGNVMMAYQAIIRQAVRALVMVSFAFVMAFRINAQVALVLLMVAPFLAIGLFFIIKNAHPLFARALATFDGLNAIVQENLRGIRVVKSYVREETETEKFKEVSTEIYNYYVKAQKVVAFNMPLIQLATYVSMIFVSWFSANLIVAGQMTTGGLMSMIAYIMQILMNLMLLSMVFVFIVISRASADRIVDVLREEPTIQNPVAPVTEVRDGSIRFSSVDFSYTANKNKLCLMGADIEIASGETIGILGGTGSSKTTLVQLIPRLYDVTSGSVSVGGVDVQQYDIETLRNQVAMVLQKNILFSGTIKENLRWGKADASDAELEHACTLAQAHSFIKEFPKGYDTHIEQGGTNVSGGQRQRLCIARALLKKPKILILDDSTSAVDTKTDASIRKAFKTEIPETTKLIIAQRVNSVQDADRIIIMDGGRINAIGTHAELLASNQIYQEVYQTQVQGGGDFDEN